MPKRSRTNHFTEYMREQIVGFAIGILLTGLLSLCIWVLAYYKYINLGLPSRFDYQILDHEIKKAVPPGYNYTINTVHNFRGPNEDTLVVVAHSIQYDKNLYGFGKNGPELSDIIIFLDKTSSGYHESYKFKPVVNPAGANGLTALIGGYYFMNNHINSQGKNDVVIGFVSIGADASPPIPLIFSDFSGNISFYSVNKLISPLNGPILPTAMTITNEYNPGQKAQATEVDNIFASTKLLAFSYIKDFVCRACDNNTYHVDYYQTTEKGLILNYPDPQLYNGYSDLISSLEKQGFSVR